MAAANPAPSSSFSFLFPQIWLIEAFSQTHKIQSVTDSHWLVAELEQVFKKFDVNGDGKILASELGSIMASLGEPTSEEELISIIKGVDFDGDGCINLDEFI
ncbi:hypothetical protein L6164_011364 [Bauhinia variegata]|uniref:Uncharacterized protein n=1 Tax=Bauhinia variegata TaxID=167791 RepID=A0ACB9P898_BAUVA|nr:hypothetical protein L6164_011364 [Bauhinia variegata]